MDFVSKLPLDLPKRGTLLEDLSDENLALDIFSRINGRKDILSILQVSRRMRKLVAANLVKTYSYGIIKFGDRGAQQYQSLLCSTLVTFLNQPELALYVEEIDLKWDFPEQNRKLELPDDEASDLLDLIFTKTGILECENGRYFALALEERNQEAYVALLLLLLGNLKILHISMTSDDEWLSWAVKNSADSSNSFLPPLSFGFGSLENVKLSPNTYGQPMDDQYTLNIHNIDSFFILPSIDRMEARCVIHYDDYKWGGSYGTSTLRHLSFYSSCIEVDVTEELLEIPKQLTSFSLEALRCDREQEGEQEVYEDFCEMLALKCIENCHVICHDLM